MDDRDYELLTILANTRNITHASQLLYISQSTVSKRLRCIEKELGKTLVLRSRQGVHFTPDGEIAVEHAKAIVSHTQLLKNQLAQNIREIHGSLRLAISVNFAHFHLAKTLAEFKQHYPHIMTHVQTNQSRYIYRELWRQQVDAAIVRGEFLDWPGERLPLYTERICLIHNEPGSVNLNTLPYISRETDSNMTHCILQWLNENKLSPNTLNTIMIVDGIQTVVSMVEAGLGWAIVPEICLSNFQGTIEPLSFANGQPLERTTNLLYYPHLMELPQLKAFVEFIREKKGVLYD